MDNLYKKSIEIILNNQGKNGAYVASPKFDTYNYCWIRDGSFIAYSMDVSNNFDSSEKFYLWIDSVIKRYSSKVSNIVQKLDNGQKIEACDFMNARYTLEGYSEKEGGWGNFQLDAYGTWLWGLTQHIKLSGRKDLLEKFKDSIYTTIKYIENLWFYPNYDIWEENKDKIHTSTLACLYGGLHSINEFLKDKSVEKTASRIKSFILTNCIKDYTFIKYIGTSDIDSSLIWLAVPFGVVDINDETFKNTIKKIENDLLTCGGLHRYKKDTYYGGGEWILLSCWLGWYYAEKNDLEKADSILSWVQKCADSEGNLPEQVFEHVNNKAYYPYWVKKWGNPASPLLWSHAMYIVLKSNIRG